MRIRGGPFCFYGSIIVPRYLIVFVSASRWSENAIVSPMQLCHIRRKLHQWTQSWIFFSPQFGKHPMNIIPRLFPRTSFCQGGVVRHVHPGVIQVCAPMRSRIIIITSRVPSNLVLRCPSCWIIAYVSNRWPKSLFCRSNQSRPHKVPSRIIREVVSNLAIQNASFLR